MATVKPVIHLLGDAILDNYYRLADQNRDLKKELDDLGFKVNNCAIDDVKVADVINGIVPNKLYTQSRKYSYPIQGDGKMYPLKSVLNNIGVNKSFDSVYSNVSTVGRISNSKDDNMVVISMGGSDIYSKIGNILFGGDYFISAVLTDEFVANFRRVIESVSKCCSKVVLVSIYLPYLGVGSSYGMYTPFSNAVLKRWNTFINGIAKEYDIPVLDLSRTLNIGTREHYGTDDTRVSNISNKCIAQCLSHIYSHYAGHRIYYSENCNISNIKSEKA